MCHSAVHHQATRGLWLVVRQMFLEVELVDVKQHITETFASRASWEQLNSWHWLIYWGDSTGEPSFNQRTDLEIWKNSTTATEVPGDDQVTTRLKSKSLPMKASTPKVRSGFGPTSGAAWEATEPAAHLEWNLQVTISPFMAVLLSRFGFFLLGVVGGYLRTALVGGRLEEKRTDRVLRHPLNSGLTLHWQYATTRGS